MAFTKTYAFYKRYQIILISVFVLVSVLFLAFESRDKDDFFIFLQGASDMFSGKDMYAISYNGGFHYLYSTFFAVLIYPLSLLPFTVAKFIWLALNFFLLYRIFSILMRYVSPLLTKEKKFFFCLITVICSLRLILDNFHYAQSTILILFLCIQGLEWIREGKNRQGALLIALGINIKLLPLVLLPYLVYRSRYSAFGLVLVFYGLMLFLPSAFIGFDENLMLLKSWWSRMNPTNEMNVLDVDERSFHGLSTLLSTLLVKNVPDIHALPVPRNIADVSLQTLGTILLLVRGIFIAFTLYFLKFPPFVKEKSQQHFFREISYLLALIPLIFPHQQHYAFLFMLPAMVYVLQFIFLHPQNKKRNRIVLPLFMLAILIFNLKLILGEFNAYYDHFKIVTYAGIIVLFLLYLVKPIPQNN